MEALCLAVVGLLTVLQAPALATRVSRRNNTEDYPPLVVDGWIVSNSLPIDSFIIDWLICCLVD